MTEKEIEERFSEIDRRLDAHDEKLDDLARRQTEIEGKMSTLLDLTADIRSMVSENTHVSQGAKNNSFWWGLLSFVSSLVFTVVRSFTGLF